MNVLSPNSTLYSSLSTIHFHSHIIYLWDHYIHHHQPKNRGSSKSNIININILNIMDPNLFRKSQTDLWSFTRGLVNIFVN